MSIFVFESAGSFAEYAARDGVVTARVARTTRIGSARANVRAMGAPHPGGVFESYISGTEPDVPSARLRDRRYFPGHGSRCRPPFVAGVAISAPHRRGAGRAAVPHPA